MAALRACAQVHEVLQPGGLQQGHGRRDRHGGDSQAYPQGERLIGGATANPAGETRVMTTPSSLREERVAMNERQRNQGYDEALRVGPPPLKVVPIMARPSADNTCT